MNHKFLICLAVALSGGLSGCASAPKNPDIRASVLYNNAHYGLIFYLPASWQGYSILVQQWQGQTYLAATDKVVILERGPVIVLRHPQWTAADPYQDIPIAIFTRRQWKALHEGKFGVGAGGIEEEIGHNRRYVFAISSRSDADDSVKGWKEAGKIVERNEVANPPPLYPE